MKRQSFIVLALAISPKYLFLDEAFDGLDPVMRLTFKRAISKMIEEKEMTVIISSHNLRELEDICDTFGILEDNTIRTAGYVDETKENIHKIQLAFKEEKREDDFKALDLLSMHVQSRVVNLVVKGEMCIRDRDEYKALKDEKQSFGSDRFDVKGIIAALGGGDNILEISNCATRLRLLVKDEKAVQSLEEFKKYGAIGLVKNGTSIQVIIGLDVPKVREQAELLLGRE